MIKTIFLVILMIVVVGIFSGCGQQTATDNNATSSTVESPTSSTTPETASKELKSSYDPKIDPDDFSTTIDNKFFTLTPGAKIIYEGEVEEGTERTEIEILNETKVVMGVTTRIYWDRVYLDGVLIEDTRDWLAQDKLGNVWYFGEEVDNYEDGKLKDHDGSWEAGVDGAKPGIWMLADPQVGETYKEEYYTGYAEDLADIVAVGQQIATKKATYKECIKTLNYTPLEPDVKENKYYCPDVGGPGIGALVLEEDLTTGEKAELISVEKKQ